MSFDHQICFLMNLFGNEAICHFRARAIARRKAWFHLRMNRTKHITCSLTYLSQTQLEILRMSIPLLVGSHLLVTWWANEKEENDDDSLLSNFESPCGQKLLFRAKETVLLCRWRSE